MRVREWIYIKPKKLSLELIICYIPVLLFTVFTVFPVLFMFSGSFMSYYEVNYSYGMLFDTDSARFAVFKLIPMEFTLNQYYMALLESCEFLYRFWNSVVLTLPILIGTLIISALGGYGFAKFNFPFKNKILFLYIIVMLLPYQVTLVPTFIVLNKLNLIGTRLAVIIPSIFAPFGVFLLSRFMENIDTDILNSGRIDGASEWRIFLSIALPMAKPGIASLAILNIIDSFSMVEQPLVLLQDVNKLPLSIALSEINRTDIGIAFVCGVVTITPVILIFLIGKEHLLEGISNSVVK